MEYWPPSGQPYAIFAAEHVDVRHDFSRGDELAIDPAEASTAVLLRGASQHAPLPGRRDRHLGRSRCVFEDDYLSVPPKKGNILTKGRRHGARYARET